MYSTEPLAADLTRKKPAMRTAPAPGGRFLFDFYLIFISSTQGECSVRQCRRQIKVTVKECTMYSTEPLSADLARDCPQCIHLIRRFGKRLPAMHSPLLPCRSSVVLSHNFAHGRWCRRFSRRLLRCRLFSPLMAATSVPPLDHVRVSTRWQIFI